jgi:DNA polymerase III delta prime subunit
MKDYGLPSPFLIQSYIDFISSKSLPSFIKLYLHLSNTPPGPLKVPIDHINSLQALNCAEELQMTRDIIQYDLHYQKIFFLPLDHTMRGLNEGVVKAKFTVIGMSESRPKISIGDIVRLRPAEEDVFALCNKDLISRNISELQGIVTSCSLKTEEIEAQFLITRQTLRDPSNIVSADGIKLHMNQILAECNKVRYHVRFTFKREGFAFISEALNNILQDESFVEVLHPELDPEVKSLRFDFDANAVLNKSELKAEPESGYDWNAEQLFAIEAISSHLWRAISYLSNAQIPKRVYANGRVIDVNKKQRLPPFIIHGPPGTGKTSTIIEAIRRLKENYPTKRVLICAPSDAAADVVSSRLMKYFSNGRLLRLNWWQRMPDSVQPPELITYCLTDARGLFDMPANAARISSTKQKVLSYDIVVTTCVCAGALRYYTDSSGSLLFDVVVVDEVSQATESEALVALSLCSPAGLMVIAGDPKQLGAEMRSPLYRLPEHSLSLQERLMTYPLYAKCQPLSTSVERNRSHRSILADTPRERETPRESPRDGIALLSPRHESFMGMSTHDLMSTRDIHASIRDVPMSPREGLISPRDTTVASVASGATSRYSETSNLRSSLLSLQATNISASSPRSFLSGSTYSSSRSIYNSDLLNSAGESSEMPDMSIARAYDLTSSMGVFLRKNYRSHHHMLHVPSKLFYQNALESYSNNQRVLPYLNWSWLPSLGAFPMLFVGVDGQHYHAIDSPSFYNLHEAMKVVEVIKSLLTETSLGITTQSIGVIGGFRSQVLKIRQLLRAESLSSINVGGVEDYQGQERDVMIISTVLTSRVPTYERYGALGLFGDDRRFNVALTRGVGLCIVIGHPMHLYSDRNWREFMEYCDEYGCCMGAPCPLLSRFVNERRDEDDLLNIAAQAALGGGYDDEAMVDMAYNVSNGRDSYWRVNL